MGGEERAEKVDKNVGKGKLRNLIAVNMENAWPNVMFLN